MAEFDREVEQPRLTARKGRAMRWKWPTGRLTFRFAVVALGLFVVLWAPSLWKRVWLQRELALLRAAGEPVTLADLDDYYRIPPDEIDSTHLWTEVTTRLHRVARQVPRMESPAELDDPPQVLDEWAEFRALIHRASASRGAARYPVELKQGWLAMLPHFGGLRAANALMLLEAHLAAESGDAAGAVRALDAAYQVSHSLRYEPTRVSLLVRLAMDEGSLGKLCRLLEKIEFRDDELASLQAALRRAEYLDHFERAYVGSRATELQALIDPATAGVNWLDRPLIPFIRVSTPAQHLRESQATLQIIREEPWRLLDRQAATASRRDQEWSLPFGSTWYSSSDESELFRQVAKRTIRNRSADAALAIVRFQQRTGNFPQQWADLVPNDLPEPPTDVLGKPLRFKVHGPSSFEVIADAAGSALAGSEKQVDQSVRIRLP